MLARSSLWEAHEDILSEGDSFPLSHGAPGTFPFGAHSWVGRRCGDFFAAFKVVAEELEDLALKGLAQLRYAERENNGRTFLESAGSHGEHDERVEAVIV